MKHFLLKYAIMLGIIANISSHWAFAQVTISYSSPQVYTYGTAITSLSPTVTAGWYGTGSTFASVASADGCYYSPATGDVYATSTSNNNGYIYNSSGTLLFTQSGTTYSYSYPESIVADASGTTFVASNSNGTVKKLTSGGVETSITGFTSPIGLAFDGSGNLYVTDAGTGDVYKIASGATTASVFLTGFTSPWGIAIDASGDMFVSQPGSNNIIEVANATSGSTTKTTFATGFNSPRCLAFDAAGYLFVADCGNSAVKKISPGGTVTTVIPSGLGTDVGISIDGSGDLYVSSFGNSKVYKFAPISYSISPALPAGLSINSYTGIISGTPTACSPATNYTVTGNNGTNSGTAIVSITVNPTVPTGTGATICGSGPGTLTASGSAPAGGTYNWYAALSGGSSLGTGASFTTPSLTSTTTYYVAYTQNGATSTPRTAVTATVTSSPVISIYPASASGNYISTYPFTGNANDASGNGNNGTVQNGATLTYDRYGAANSAYSFNGTNQYISTTTSYTAPATFSISLWFNTTTTTGGRLIGFGSAKTGVSGSDDRHVYMNNSGQLYFGIYSSPYFQTISTSTSYNDGNWHNVIATFSGSTGMKLYVDGTLVTYNVTYTTGTTYTGYWKIGYDNLSSWQSAPTSNYFAGSLDDIAIYNRELTAAEVYSLNGAGSTPFCPGGTLTLQANTVSGATYSWSGPNSFTSTLQNPTISGATSANVGSYTVTVTNASGCSSTTMTTTQLASVPSATFSYPAAALPNTTAYITYSGTDPSSSTFTWNFGGGTVISGSGIGPYQVQWSTTGNKTVTLMVTNSSGCMSSTTSATINVNTTSWYSTYVYRKKVTLDATKVSGTGTLANFPVLLKIVDPDFIYVTNSCTNKIQSPVLNDLAFVDAGSPQSNELPYEIDTYDSTTGTLLVWVQLSSLSSNGAGCTLYYYYGSNAPPAHFAASSTWGSDYKAVFHFNQKTFSAAAGAVTESTSNAFNATTSNMTAASLVTGQIGKAYNYSTSSISTGSDLNIVGDHTLSAWVYTTTTSADEKVMTNQDASTYLGYKLACYFGSVETENQTDGTGKGSDRGFTPAANMTANSWHYIQGITSGTQLYVFMDGVQYATCTVTIGGNLTATTFYIGVGESGNTYYWNGMIDEVRVSTVAKTSDWIKTEYNNQLNPTSSGTAPFISSIANIEYSMANFNSGYSPGSMIYTWTGTGGTGITTAANWNITSVTPNVASTAPTGNYSTLNIPGSAASYPTLTAALSVYSMTLASGAQFNLNGNTLSVGCNVYNSSGGQILYGSNTSSGLTWNGNLASQYYYGSSTASTCQTGNMMVSNSAAGTVNISGGDVDVYGNLTMTTGNLVIGASPAALTLKSTASQTANVAAIPSTCSITGNVNVERYITGGSGYRGYRLISSPVYAATVSSNNVYSINYLDTYTYLTGSGGGFDKTGNPTLYLYREDQTPSNTTFISGNFEGISAINNSPVYNYSVTGAGTSGTYYLPVGDGVMFFFRGNRSSATLAAETTPSYTTPVTVTTVTSGTLNQGQVIVHDWYTPASAYLGYTGTGTGTNHAVRGFNLVGNPYASSIDWEQYNTTTNTTGIYANNVGTSIYEYNDVTHNYAVYQKVVFIPTMVKGP
jgi:sugar lactone lactonase YvrE